MQDTLQQAADLLGAPLNQFVLQAALDEAQRVLERSRMIYLSRNDAEFLLGLLETPPASNARLRRALRKYMIGKVDAKHSTFDWAVRSKPPRKREQHI